MNNIIENAGEEQFANGHSGRDLRSNWGICTSEPIRGIELEALLRDARSKALGTEILASIKACRASQQEMATR